MYIVGVCRTALGICVKLKTLGIATAVLIGVALVIALIVPSLVEEAVETELRSRLAAILPAWAEFSDNKHESGNAVPRSIGPGREPARFGVFGQHFRTNHQHRGCRARRSTFAFGFGAVSEIGSWF